MQPYIVLSFVGLFQCV